MNALVGERMSIITNKPQTTRRRIIGILSSDEYQIVFSDTPGFIRNPAYKMQEAMNQFVRSTFEDADVMLFVVEPLDRYEDENELLENIKNIQIPLILVLNKIDLIDTSTMPAIFQYWKDQIPNIAFTIGISALKKTNTDALSAAILQYLPEGPEFYPKDQLTDRPERFFVGEIIREKILLNYRDEIPYSCEVTVESYKETKTVHGEPLIRIGATVFVSRESQKSILLGKNGVAIKKCSTAARIELETFLQSKIFLEITVKVKDNWRDDERHLKYFGYSH